eukprot:6438155-Prymnesium_polylepis.1
MLPPPQGAELRAGVVKRLAWDGARRRKPVSQRARETMSGAGSVLGCGYEAHIPAPECSRAAPASHHHTEL